MKKILFVLGLLFMVSFVNAQNFEKGDMGLNLGIGIGDPSTYAVMVPIPAVNASFEVGIVDIPNVGVIGVGGFAQFRNTWYNYSGYTDRYTNMIFAGRGVFHFGFFDTGNFDLYAGLHTGYCFYRYSYDSYYDINDYTHSYFLHDVFAGARWMKNDKFGFFAELGYGTSFLKAGVSFKF